MLLFVLVLDIVLQESFVLGGCFIKCGVLDKQINGDTLLDMVKEVWRQLQSTGHVDPEQVTITFHPEPMRTQMDWDTLSQVSMDLQRSNASVLIGPYSNPIVTSSERLGIPYFLTDAISPQVYNPINLITVFPNSLEINRICLHIIKKYNWKDLLIFYDNQHGVQLIEELLNIPELHIRAKRLDTRSTPVNIKAFLLEMRHILVTNFVIAANKTWTTTILNEALYVSMLSNRHSWILLAMDLEDSDVELFSYTDVNLTSIDIGQGQLTFVKSRLHFSPLDYLILYDSLLTMHNMMLIQFQKQGQCAALGRQDLIENVQLINTEGASGRLTFTKDGGRDGYFVNIMSLSTKGLYQSGQWNSADAEEEHRLILNPDDADIIPAHEYPLGKQIVNVVTIIEPPFTQYRAGRRYYKGNEQFEGFCMDLLHHIAEKIGFQYRVYVVPNGPFGSQDEDGNWNGVIGDILSGNASLAVSPLTITSQREEVLDFAKPYKPRGLSIVMKKSRVEVSFFQFLEPLSIYVWALMGVTLIVVSCCIYLVDKIAPPKEPAKPLNSQECLWFTFASLVLNGTDIVPRTIACKILAGSLWLFSLIIISSYTANLAAFLTVSKFHTPIHSVYDIKNQDEVAYGTVWSSATSDFFQYSQIDYFKEMWQYMAISHPSGMVNSSDEGFEKVRNSTGDYAFIWDDDVLRHETNKECDIKRIGHVFDTSKGYGIAMPKGASYRDAISMAILELREDGILGQLEHKWWKPPICPGESNPTGNRRKSLAISGVAGVFIVLLIGVVLAILVAIAECLWRQRFQKKKAPNDVSSESTNLTIYDDHQKMQS